MTKNERIVLWASLGVLAAWLLVLTVIVAAELAQLNRQLLVLAGDEVSAGGEQSWWGTPAPGSGQGGADPPAAGATEAPSWGGSGGETQVGIAGLQVLTDSVVMTVTVRAYGAGDLLFEPPVLYSEEGQVYQVTGASLEAARLAFLDLVTRSDATARFEFAGRLAPTAGLWLIFNANQDPTSATAPPLEVAVPLRAGQ